MVGKPDVQKYLEQANTALSNSERALQRIAEVNFNVQDALQNSRQAISTAQQADLTSNQGKEIAIAANTKAISALNKGVEALNSATQALEESDRAQNQAISANSNAIAATNLTAKTIPRFMHITKDRINAFTTAGGKVVRSSSEYGTLFFQHAIVVQRTSAVFKATGTWTGSVIMIGVGEEGNSDIVAERIDNSNRSTKVSHGSLVGSYKSATVIIFPDE